MSDMVEQKNNRTMMTETKSISVAFSTCSSCASTRVLSMREEECIAREKLRGFNSLVGLSQVFGLLPLFSLTYWIFSYAGGFKFPKAKIFNSHILLLFISFVYLNGNNLLTFRILRERPKNILKLIHAIVGSVICVLGILGVWIAFPKNGFLSYYSLHSWIGIFTLIVFIVQTVGGVYAFLYPGFKSKNRAILMPYHRYSGLILFILATVAAVTGICERAVFMGRAYKQQAFEGFLLNFSGFLIVLFAIFVTYMVSNLSYKRYPRLLD